MTSQKQASLWANGLLASTSTRIHTGQNLQMGDTVPSKKYCSWTIFLRWMWGVSPFKFPGPTILANRIGALGDHAWFLKLVKTSGASRKSLIREDQTWPENPQTQWNLRCDNIGLWMIQKYTKTMVDCPASHLFLVARVPKGAYIENTFFRCFNSKLWPRWLRKPKIPDSFLKGKSSLWNKVVPQQYSKASHLENSWDLMGWWWVRDFDLGQWWLSNPLGVCR